MNLSVNVHTDGAHPVVAPVGELDVATAPGLLDTVMSMLSDGCRQLVIDLTGLSFLDSSGLSVLIAARNRLLGNGNLVIVCADPRLLKVFALAGLDQVLSVESTIVRALARLSPAAALPVRLIPSRRTEPDA